MLARMDDLPSEFAVEIGRIVYHSAHADFLLNRLLAVQKGAPEGKGPRHSMSASWMRRATVESER